MTRVLQMSLKKCSGTSRGRQRTSEGCGELRAGLGTVWSVLPSRWGSFGAASDEILHCT